MFRCRKLGSRIVSTRTQFSPHRPINACFGAFRRELGENWTVSARPLLTILRSESRLKTMTTQQYVKKVLSEYPEFVTKEQLYKICHISKRRATFLLESGYIPCTDTGKKTRRFIIATKDIADFLIQREIDPEKYTQPKGSFSSRSTDEKPVLQRQADRDYLKRLKWFYQSMLKKEEDVLTVRDISRLTGYTESTVHHWVQRHRLKAMTINARYRIPKEWLVEFLLSREYRSIDKKSAAHRAAMLRFKAEYNE